MHWEPRKQTIRPLRRWGEEKCSKLSLKELFWLNQSSSLIPLDGLIFKLHWVQGSELMLCYVFHVIETEEIVLGITACSC